jgi:hypothetical protein
MKNFFRSLCLLACMYMHTATRAQVPVLSSYPAAPAVIFLDFDGHTVAGTTWNFSGSPIVCGGSGLTDAQITEVFNRVAEDYRPFNLNITTDSTKFLAAPANKRMRVIVTVSSSWYGSAGGVAFTGSFLWGDDSPCFVFSALLGYNIKFVAEAASHEAGHALGMYHQAYYDASCNKISDYYGGLGSGEIGWAPIMGVGYYKNFTLWNNGPNSYGCTNYQSDLDVITSAANGFGYRTDDHSNSFASATAFTFTSNQFDVNGVIERNTDNDIFKFIMPFTGRFELNAVPYNVGTGNSGSDLDLQVTLYDGSETPLNVYNPGTLLSSVVDTTLSAGTYYLKIEGKGNQYAPAYASLGSYSLVGNFDGTGTTLPLRRLQLIGSQNGDVHQLSWIIDADEEVLQQVLEASYDGRNFATLTETDKDDRAYAYRPHTNATAQYRLQVTFSNGRINYSNVVTLQETRAGDRPKLVSNLITSNAIYISSPGDFSYMIIDLNGKAIRTGLLSNGVNHLDASGLSRGMYVVRFTGNNQQWTDKLLRQ